MSAEPKHSPGPWQIFDGVTDAVHGVSEVISDVNGYVVVEVPERVCQGADARLIAAAPKMFELLREAKARNYGHGEWWQDVCKLLAEIEP